VIPRPGYLLLSHLTTPHTYTFSFFALILSTLLALLVLVSPKLGERMDEWGAVAAG
jgi:hypothetical protein